MELDLFDRPDEGILSPQGEVQALRHASPRAAAALARWLPVADDVELAHMAQRQQQAQALGFGALEAGHVADRLHLRDREQSGMTLCCECLRLRGRPGAWRCSSLAGAPGALAADLVARLPQRCPGFDAAPGWPAPPAAVGAEAAAGLEPF